VTWYHSCRFLDPVRHPRRPAAPSPGGWILPSRGRLLQAPNPFRSSRSSSRSSSSSPSLLVRSPRPSARRLRAVRAPVRAPPPPPHRRPPVARSARRGSGRPRLISVGRGAVCPSQLVFLSPLLLVPAWIRRRCGLSPSQAAPLSASRRGLLPRRPSSSPCAPRVHACAAALLPLAGSSIGRRRGLPSPAMRLASPRASCLSLVGVLPPLLLCWLQSSASSSVAPPSPRRAPPPAPVLDAAPFLAADLPANHRPRVLRPAIHELSRCSARGFSWPSLCASRGGFPSTGGAAAVGSQSAGAISIFPVVISSSAHLSFFSIQYTFSAAVSCYCKSLLGENRGSDYMSTGARSWLIIICYCCHVASNFSSSIGSNW